MFVEKPLAETIDECQELFDLANSVNKKLYVGYILMTHPSWNRFIEVSHDLGKPLAMRMNLNQQAKGDFTTHSTILCRSSLIRDCGVHYLVDINHQMAQSKPVRVHAIGCRNWDKVPEHINNYGQLQVEFEDGSVGWYEAGWGPMMSEVAYFVKKMLLARMEQQVSARTKVALMIKIIMWKRIPSSAISRSRWTRNSSKRTK